ncbi:MAG: ATP-binding cassette domain-containing protein [Dehalococcoidia bacterium]|nr:ATP-binding cassette domain-containing protein [Dehalococcoidia bacterium]
MDVHVERLIVERGGRPVLDIPELEIAGERVTALLGPNGAGKSTLLRALAGLEQPAQGRVTLDGIAVRDARQVSSSVAYAFQEPALFRGTVQSNLDFALRLRGLERRERRNRIAALAADFGIDHLLNVVPPLVGEARHQRRARPRARAPLTLLDEPLAALDQPSRDALLGILPGMLRQHTRTAVIVTHDRGEAVRLADDIVILVDGRVRLAAPRQAAFSNPPDAETAAFLGYVTPPAAAACSPSRPACCAPGKGEHAFEMQVEAALRTPAGHEVLGEIDGVRTTVVVPLGSPIPHPGECWTVSAPAGSVREFEVTPGEYR